jgi:multiple sugar transport system substrate-binding protein
LLSAKLSANQPAKWHTLAILHTLQMPHSPVFLRRGSALTRKIAFQNGELIFLRNWAYVYRLAEKTDGSSKVAGKFGVAPLPGLNGPGVSTLGGHNLAIGTNAANKGTAADFIKFMSSEEVAKADTLATGQAHVNRALYSDPDILKKFPHFPILLKSIETAKPRPKVVNYGDATLAMQDAATSALQGQVPPEVALSDLQSQLESLTK